MSSNRSYEDLKVWRKSLDLVKLVYRLTLAFPNDERYGLTSQTRRCAVSVPSNIAEGCGRNNPKEFIQFLGIASGSLAELHTQMIIAYETEMLSQENYAQLCASIEEIRRMLAGLRTSLKQPQAA